VCACRLIIRNCLIREVTIRESSFRETSYPGKNHPGNDCKPSGTGCRCFIAVPIWQQWVSKGYFVSSFTMRIKRRKNDDGFTTLKYMCVIPYFSYCVFQTDSLRSVGIHGTRAAKPHQVMLSVILTTMTAPFSQNSPNSHGKYSDSSMLIVSTLYPCVFSRVCNSVLRSMVPASCWFLWWEVHAAGQYSDKIFNNTTVSFGCVAS